MISTILLLCVLIMLIEMRYRLRAGLQPLTQHNSHVAKILSSIGQYRDEMRAGIEQLQGSPAPEHHDVHTLIHEADARFAHVQKLLEALHLETPAPQPSTVPESHPVTSTSTLKLHNADGSEECEVAWHRHEVPTIMTYAGKVFHRQDHPRADGVWEFHHAS